MKIQTKISILFLILFISGCAHHKGYYSGYSGSASYGISIDSYSPYSFYSTHHDKHHQEYDHVYKRNKNHHKYDHKRRHYAERSSSDRYLSGLAYRHNKHSGDHTVHNRDFRDRYNHQDRNNRRERKHFYRNR